MEAPDGSSTVPDMDAVPCPQRICALAQSIRTARILSIESPLKYGSFGHPQISGRPLEQARLIGLRADGPLVILGGNRGKKQRNTQSDRKSKRDHAPAP